MQGPNDPCACGSGKKFKKCCGGASRHNAARHQLLSAVAQHQAGKLDVAEEAYRALIESNPGHADALHYLGLIHFQRGNPEAAAQWIRQAIAIQPTHPVFYCNLGNALKRMGLAESADEAYATALHLAPDFVEVWINRGTLWLNSGDAARALASAQRASETGRQNPDAWLLLSNVQYELGQLDASAASLRTLLSLQPDHLVARQNLATLQMRFGDAEGALQNYLVAARRDPDNPERGASVLMARLYLPHEPLELLAEHQQFSSRYYPEPDQLSPRQARKLSGRRMRIAYLSPDLRRHAMRFFARPMSMHHDRERFEVFWYHTPAGPDDEVTAEFRGRAEHWVDARGWDDQRLYTRLIEDDLDCLIDLAGHTQGGRMAVLARRVAPVQATMLGYLGPTGVKAMDYRLSDRRAIPESDQPWFNETALYFDACQWCYVPDAGVPEVGELPARKNAYITFGAFHQVAKITDEAARLWAAILASLPDSRLQVIVWGEESRRIIEARFVKAGLPIERVDFMPLANHDEYFHRYAAVDISLDVFPYAGGTVSCDSLFMGVPVVSYAAPYVAGKGGASLLAALGLDQLIAETPQAYVAAAVRLASDIQALADLRQTLRGRMTRSPLMDASAYVRELEVLISGVVAAKP